MFDAFQYANEDLGALSPVPRAVDQAKRCSKYSIQMSSTAKIDSVVVGSCVRVGVLGGAGKHSHV